MICHNCHLWRSQLHSEVKKKGKVVGFLCKKCNQKHLAGMIDSNKSWRERFKEFCRQAIKSKIKLENMGVA